jgi:hypothetical protein
MVFESKERLGKDVVSLLDALRERSGGRYACVLEPSRVLFESAAPGLEGGWALKQLFEQRPAELFALPARMASGEDMGDLFDAWDRDEFLLAFLNGRVAIAVVCAEAEALREGADALLQTLADRLLRFDERWRLDEQGRGLFMGHPRLDVVVVGRAAG